MRHLEFVLKIRCRAQTFHDDINIAALIEVIRKQSVKARYLHIRDIPCGFLQELAALLHAEAVGFERVYQHHDHQLVEHFRGALDYVEMSVSHGVEAAGVDCCFHSSGSFPGSSSACFGR